MFPMLTLMETRLSPAEELPALYRAILDAVAELERRGERREAGAVRVEATKAYAIWDEEGRRRLIQLRRRLDRALEPPERRILPGRRAASEPATEPFPSG
jgi:hypothetical protein